MSINTIAFISLPDEDLHKHIQIRMKYMYDDFKLKKTLWSPSFIHKCLCCKG